MKKLAFLALLGAALVSAAPAEAQRPARGGQPGRGAPAVVIPAALVAALNSNPAGGEGLSQAVTNEMLNAPNPVAVVIALSRAARTPEQKAAIALGVLRALQTIGRTDPVRARALFNEFRADPVLYATLLALQTVEIAEGGRNGGIVFYPGGGGFSSGGGSPGRGPCFNVSCN